MKTIVLAFFLFFSIPVTVNAGGNAVLNDNSVYHLQGFKIMWQYGDIENIALQTAKTKTDTLRHGNGYILEARHNGTNANGCDIVSVEKRYDPKMFKRQWIDIYNFVICNGAIVTQEESPLEYPSIPNEIIKTVAKNTQKYGYSEANYFDYVIKGMALRDKEMCKVQIKIMKGISLLTIQEVDACK